MMSLVSIGEKSAKKKDSELNFSFHLIYLNLHFLSSIPVYVTFKTSKKQIFSALHPCRLKGRKEVG